MKILLTKVVLYVILCPFSGREGFSSSDSRGVAIVSELSPQKEGESGLGHFVKPDTTQKGRPWNSEGTVSHLPIIGLDSSLVC